ncbi:MAG: hypothetical protein HY820_45980 [Acidobacteria bacterium]|nr:hypothetical protein [Acidobacteriota bacterium]
MAESRGEWVAILEDGARRFAGYAAVFLTDDPAVRAGPAFAEVLESKDTVVTLRDASQLGGALGRLPEALSGRCYLFPVLMGDEVAAVVYAEDAEQPDRNALELLGAIASGTLPGLQDSAPAAGGGLIQIGGAKARLKVEIPEADRALHWKAQRYARVHVAQMLIDQYEAVEHGRRNRALYVYLKDPIELQRKEFRKLYLDTCASMTDYYHEELVRTLANNEAPMLGPQYPGAMR